MSAQRGFLFNGAAIGGGHASYEDDDSDSDYEDEQTPMHYEASFQPSSNASSAAAAAAGPVAPLVPIFGDVSKLKLKREVGLPMLGPQRRPNSAEDIRDLTMRSELETEFWEDVDKMLHKRPVRDTHVLVSLACVINGENTQHHSTQSA